jgi:hypothetical protein
MDHSDSVPPRDGTKIFLVEIGGGEGKKQNWRAGTGDNAFRTRKLSRREIEVFGLFKERYRSSIEKPYPDARANSIT